MMMQSGWQTGLSQRRQLPARRGGAGSGPVPIEGFDAAILDEEFGLKEKATPVW